MVSLSRSGGRKELRGVVRLCWSSGAPQTLPPPSPPVDGQRLEPLLATGPPPPPPPRLPHESTELDLASAE